MDQESDQISYENPLGIQFYLKSLNFYPTPIDFKILFFKRIFSQMYVCIYHIQKFILWIPLWITLSRSRIIKNIQTNFSSKFEQLDLQ